VPTQISIGGKTMLVLTRRLSEKVKETDIMITTPTGDIIKVAVVQIKGKQVRIGVDTPEGYHIDRAEIFGENTIKRNNLITNPTP
jgi:carbon storage regulator CsrA